jgi:hypothetical protein
MTSKLGQSEHIISGLIAVIIGFMTNDLLLRG